MTTVPDLSKKIGDALFNIQLLEGQIREYLDYIANIIKKSVRILPSNFSLYDKNDTLGTLVKRFSNVCQNKNLVKSLNQISIKRNKLVHEIWLDFRDEHRKIRRLENGQPLLHMIKYSSVKSGEVREIEREAELCLEGIKDEWETSEKRLKKIQGVTSNDGRPNRIDNFRNFIPYCLIDCNCSLALCKSYQKGYTISIIYSAYGRIRIKGNV